MTVDDLKRYYGVENDYEVAQIIKKTRGAISKWRSRGIPINTQAFIQIQTNGALKADLKQNVA